MAKVTEQEVLHIAHLARLKFNTKELKSFSLEFNKIIEYIDTLNELDTKGITPTSHVIDMKNIFREDKLEKGLSNEEALANAPQKNNGFFVVPRVL